MIPKIIHYCWFGGNPKHELIQNCINSWKKYCPDYEIIEWNEDNFDVNICRYTREAYEAKKWAFVSDFARLYVLYHHGGVYFDTDVEVLRPIDEFLADSAFTGFEANDSPVTAVMGAEKNHPLFGQLLEYYNDVPFINGDGSFNMLTNTHIITDIFVKKGIRMNGKKQIIEGMTVYPQILFCPNNFTRIFDKHSRKSYTIHHFDQSWKSEKTEKKTFAQRVRRYSVGVLRNLYGTDKLERLRDK